MNFKNNRAFFYKLDLFFSVHDKKRKKTKHSRGRNYQETYDQSNSAGYLQDYSAHLGRAERDRVRAETERAGHSQSGVVVAGGGGGAVGGSGAGGQRFSDMAPK